MAKTNADTGLIESCFDDAYSLKEEKTDVLKRIDANRKILRTLADAGKLDEDQYALLTELYPPRKRGEDSDTDDTDETDGE